MQKNNHQDQLDYDFIFCQGKSPRKILIFVENINATYYLSFHYVLQKLHQKDEVDFWVISSQTIINNYAQYNPNPINIINKILTEIAPQIVIFSRYGLPYGSIFQQQCQEKAIATIYHIDDDLLNIPLSLGEGIQKQHGNKEVIQEREYLLNNVDLIYASTPYLATTLAKRFPQQKFYYGIYAPYLEFLIPKNNDIDKKQQNTGYLTLGYMGSKGHQEDLRMITPDLVKILANFPHIRFETFGTIAMPEELKQFSERIKSHKVNVNYENFLQNLYTLKWDIGLAPLQNTDFNNCKASTKYIEYTSSDIPTIASNLDVYNKFIPGSEIILAQPDEWYKKMKLLIDDASLRALILQNARVRCSQEFSLEVLEKQISTTINFF
ncbi:glycosyltransferase [Calothrix sp. PCC 7507]|uniref:glycosyltransferase family protein n=1 Tax=Calothrix sp. PCC 7507 TaxID=99598 RepID=UPI00029EE7C3|nr:glycosyltransferase [Calothrix sp. PCC 7507]AFY35625.1 glycosyltransferase-like protein [Calothrix sp. PCC 7507]